MPPCVLALWVWTVVSIPLSLSIWGVVGAAIPTILLLIQVAAARLGLVQGTGPGTAAAPAVRPVAVVVSPGSSSRSSGGASWLGVSWLDVSWLDVGIEWHEHGRVVVISAGQAGSAAAVQEEGWVVVSIEACRQLAAAHQPGYVGCGISHINQGVERAHSHVPIVCTYNVCRC